MKKIFVYSVSLLVCFSGFTADQSANPTPQFGEKILFSKPAKSIKVDGVLSEPEWKKSGTVADFTLGSHGVKPLPTTVKALHDDNNIYLGFICKAIEKEKLLVVQPEGGKVYRDDSVEIFFDPDHTGRQCYQLIVNAIGTVTVIDKGTMKYMKRGDFIDTKTSWNEQEKTYTIEVALDRKKYNLTGPLTHSSGIGFLRNQEAKKGGNRGYRFLWHSGDPRQWGHLYLLDQKNFKALKQSFQKRLDTILGENVGRSFKQQAKSLKTQVKKLRIRDEKPLVGLEAKLISLEKDTYWQTWKIKFDKLF